MRQAKLAEETRLARQVSIGARQLVVVVGIFRVERDGLLRELLRGFQITVGALHHGHLHQRVSVVGIFLDGRVQCSVSAFEMTAFDQLVQIVVCCPGSRDTAAHHQDDDSPGKFRHASLPVVG